MELILNLCWLMLLLPAYMLWRQKASSEFSKRSSAFFILTLGFAVLLLFPVISASDDLHAVGQAMEESEGMSRQDAHRACVHHGAAHLCQPALPACESFNVSFEVFSLAQAIEQSASRSLFTTQQLGRAPPPQFISL